MWQEHAVAALLLLMMLLLLLRLLLPLQCASEHARAPVRHKESMPGGGPVRGRPRPDNARAMRM